MEENDKFDDDELIDEIQNILLDDAYRIDDGSIESMLGIEGIESIEGSESNKKANCNPNEKLECSCGRMYTRTNKSRHFKKWHDEQPVINSQRNVSITCYCGRMYTRTNKSRHFKKWHP